ncbi:hypothetical protein [Bacteroides fluxus]|uniref:hypothetical protein n=1 Tax=Bacteroides fluxus TaxID=626930 RepID=UPI0023526F01|nr:hypothetical protein [Bacteroides fluxus]MDY3790301.1 hypothetical protein [Bacteroides fluxus]
MEKENLKNEIKTINEQEEVLGNEQLESTTGGATECTCDCWIGNSNADRPKEKTSKEKNTLDESVKL